MTIYILDNDPVKTAQYLDDKSLDRMIRDIAQVLCNVHWLVAMEKGKAPDCPLSLTTTNKKYYKELWGNPCDMSKATIKWYKWTQWARECVANYEYLWKLGIACDWELAHRNDFKLSKKYHDILEWARDNVPDLGGIYCKCEGQFVCDHCHFQTSFPLVMPNKYQKTDIIVNKQYLQDLKIDCYRNYYQAKLKQRMRQGDPNDWHDHAEDSEHVGCTHTIKWTRREKPEWLHL